MENVDPELLIHQEKLLKKLDILIDRKEMRDSYWERKKKGWAIIIKALRRHNILSPQKLEQIARLEIF